MQKSIVFVSENKEQVKELYDGIKAHSLIKSKLIKVKLDEDFGHYAIIECSPKKFVEVLCVGTAICDKNQYTDMRCLTPDQQRMLPVLKTEVKENV